MSTKVFEGKGIIITSFAGPKKLRCYQINFDGKYIVVDIITILRLRNVLGAMCFDNPPCATHFHKNPELYDHMEVYENLQQ